MSDTVDQLGQVAVAAAAKSAMQYLKHNDREADPVAMCECLKSWCKAMMQEALKDAKDAIDAGMGKVAEMTFLATMAKAGIEAAKECSFPKMKVTASTFQC